MEAVWQAVAQEDVGARPPLWDPWLLWLTLVLVVVILLGALVLVWIDRWRKRTGSEHLSASDQLAGFRKLYDEGQLSQEEFQRIRALLSRQLQRELDLPAGPPPAAPQPKPEAPAAPGNPPGSNPALPAE